MKDESVGKGWEGCSSVVVVEDAAVVVVANDEKRRDMRLWSVAILGRF
jgi:hypothetical protein